MTKGYLTALVASVVIGLGSNSQASAESYQCVETPDGYAFVEEGVGQQNKSPKDNDSKRNPESRSYAIVGERETRVTQKWKYKDSVF